LFNCAAISTCHSGFATLRGSVTVDFATQISGFRPKADTMKTIEPGTSLVDEIADFLATTSSREELLQFRPSEPVQERVRELLAKLKTGQLSEDERRELDRFEHLEVLMRLVKVRLRLPADRNAGGRISIKNS